MPEIIKTKFNTPFYEKISEKLNNDQLIILPTERVHYLLGHILSLWEE